MRGQMRPQELSFLLLLRLSCLQQNAGGLSNGQRVSVVGGGLVGSGGGGGGWRWGGGGRNYGEGGRKLVFLCLETDSGMLILGQVL